MDSEVRKDNFKSKNCLQTVIQRLNDLERLFASSSQQKLDKDSTFAQLNSEYEKSLKTLETFRIKELLRIDTIEQPSKREQAKIEFTETEFSYPRKLSETKFWLMLFPENESNLVSSSRSLHGSAA